MKIVKIEGVGHIKYNRPNIPQKLRLLSKMGMSPTKQNVDLNFEVMATIMESVGDLIEEVSCKIKSKKIDTWEKVLAEESLMDSVIMIITNIINPQEDKSEVKKS